MVKEELEKKAKTECFMLTVNTIGIDQRDVELAYVMGAEPREKQIADLEKENAELKEKNNNLVASSKTIISLSDEIETRTMEQLTKAKEILRSLYFIIQSRIDYKNNIEIADEMWRAEQFLNSEVEK